jgi:SAM-dependent methyltransferase
MRCGSRQNVTDTAEWFETFPDGLWLRGVRSADDGAQAQRVWKLLRLRAGQRVLDVPCGRGRIAFELAKRGIRVVGVDATRRFVDSARARFRRNELSGEFVRGDMRRIDFEGRFHAAYNWFGSFGYFSERENAEFLKRLALAVRPGGRVLVEQANREWILRQFRARDESPGLRTRGRWNPRTQRVEVTWQYLAGRHWRRSRSSIRLYTPAQLSALFRKAGLTVDTICDWEGKPFTRASPRLIFVGHKTP